MQPRCSKIVQLFSCERVGRLSHQLDLFTVIIAVPKSQTTPRVASRTLLKKKQRGSKKEKRKMPVLNDTVVFIQKICHLASPAQRFSCFTHRTRHLSLTGKTSLPATFLLRLSFKISSTQWWGRRKCLGKTWMHNTLDNSALDRLDNSFNMPNRCN